MTVSVRVERVRELPEGQRVAVEPHPNGTTTIRMLAEDIDDETACCLGAVLTCAKQNVYYPLLLAHTALRSATPAN